MHCFVLCFPGEQKVAAIEAALEQERLGQEYKNTGETDENNGSDRREKRFGREYWMGPS